MFKNQKIFKNTIKDKVIFSYFGNIGRAQKLDYFLDLFMKVRNQKYEINIFGSGSEKTELMKKYKDQKLYGISTKMRKISCKNTKKQIIFIINRFSW